MLLFFIQYRWFVSFALLLAILAEPHFGLDFSHISALISPNCFAWAVGTFTRFSRFSDESKWAPSVGH